MRRATAQQVGGQAVLLLVGGPAGAGKSTVATAWCYARQRAVRIDLDQVRGLIIAGRADPQILTSLQVEQMSSASKPALRWLVSFSQPATTWRWRPSLSRRTSPGAGVRS